MQTILTRFIYMLVNYFFLFVFGVLQMQYNFQGVDFFLLYLEYIVFLVFVDLYFSSVLENSVIISSDSSCLLFYIHSWEFDAKHIRHHFIF